MHFAYNTIYILYVRLYILLNYTLKIYVFCAYVYNKYMYYIYIYNKIHIFKVYNVIVLRFILTDV